MSPRPRRRKPPHPRTATATRPQQPLAALPTQTLPFPLKAPLVSAAKKDFPVKAPPRLRSKKGPPRISAAVLFYRMSVKGYDLFVVHLHQLLQVLEAGLCLVLVALEQHVRALGELAGQTGVAGLVH